MNEQIMEILNDLRPEFDFMDSEDFVMDGLLDSFDIISLVSMLGILSETIGCFDDEVDNYSFSAKQTMRLKKVMVVQ